MAQPQSLAHGVDGVCRQGGDIGYGYDVDNVQRHWDSLEPAYKQFAKALQSTVNFIRSPDVGILSRTLSPLRRGQMACLSAHVLGLYKAYRCRL